MISRCGLVFLTMLCLPVVWVRATAQTPSASEPKAVIFYNEDGVQSPALAQTDFSPVVSSKCEYEGAGIVRLSLVVNAEGRSEKVSPLYPFHDDIDKAAVSIAEVDRFSPGTKDGVPVAVAQELEVRLTACRIKTEGKDGTTSVRLRLETAPIQKLFPAPKHHLPALAVPVSQVPATAEMVKQLGKMRSDITPPVALVTPEAQWPQEMRNVEGVCIVRLVVDAKGQPQALRIEQGTNKQFNEKALEAVEKYRFKPARKGQDPIPVMMSIVVHFKLH